MPNARRRALGLVQINASDWWAARLVTTEDRVQALSRRLALQLRRAWDARRREHGV